jgi:hypothetical protein
MKIIEWIGIPGFPGQAVTRWDLVDEFIEGQTITVIFQELCGVTWNKCSW